MTDEEREKLIETIALQIGRAQFGDWVINPTEKMREQARAALDVAEPVIREQADNALNEEITRLRAELTAAQTVASEHETDAIEVDEERFVAWAERDRAVAERDALREENARLREALGPFAKMLKGNYSHQSDDMPIKAGANQYDLVFVFTLGDLRATAAAIREGGKDE